VHFEESRSALETETAGTSVPALLVVLVVLEIAVVCPGPNVDGWLGMRCNRSGEDSTCWWPCVMGSWEFREGPEVGCLG